MPRDDQDRVTTLPNIRVSPDRNRPARSYAEVMEAEATAMPTRAIGQGIGA